MKFNDLPPDWKTPEWEVESKIHNWRNHATGNIIDLWNSFDVTQKKVIAQCLQIIADKEHWD